jgi:glycosyltransferase involved in cell wall biosynthesis
MKILYVHRTAGTRVEGVHIREMVRAFEALGHEVRLVNPPGCDPMRSAEPKEERIPSNGLRDLIRKLPRCLPAWIFEIFEVLYSLGLVIPLYLRARTFKPDFIYERTSTCQFAATLVGMWRRIPVVQEVNQTVSIGRLRPLYFRRMAQALEGWVFERSSLLLTVSGRFREMMIEHGSPREKISVIPNAADIDRFRPDASPANVPGMRDDGRVTLGYVGSFVVWHNLDSLLDMVKQGSAQPMHARLLLVGDGPERARLTRRTEEMAITDRVFFAGAVPHDKLPGYIRLMDAAVMANATEYASPVKMFEYMAMGKAVVAPRVPPVEEIVRNGETALLFAPQDSASMVAAVHKVVTDSELRRRLGRDAREYIVQNRTWRKNASRVIEMITQLGTNQKDRPA